MMSAMEATTGLRERKKQRTREAIVEAAFELFAERGFAGTTIADIAEAAEIAPRTFFSYFPSKDDVVFHDFEKKYGVVAGWLRDREPGTNAIDALYDGVRKTSGAADETLHAREKRLRRRLVRDNESLAAHDDHLRGKFVDMLAEAVAQDLGETPQDLRPRIVAAATTAAIGIIEELPDDAPERSQETIDSLLVFLRAGLSALQDDGRP
jgi:AcrR family transcriptional regulator